MAPRKKKVLLVSDVGDNTGIIEWDERFRHPDWETERDVFQTLKKLGYEPSVLGLGGSLDELTQRLANSGEWVFNLNEGFRGQRQWEAHVVSFLELMEVSHSGASSETLQLCRDKALSKKLVSFHDVSIPRFDVVKTAERPRCLKVPFPAVVKPLAEDASDGITQASLVLNDTAAWKRLAYLREKVGGDAIVEEYIAGREFYVGVVKGRVLAPIELRIGKPKERYLATYQLKWNESYRKRWRVSRRYLTRREAYLEKALVHAAHGVSEALKISGYARIDFRVTPNGEVFFLEANPNPSLAKHDEFALSARGVGLDYPALIQTIVPF